MPLRALRDLSGDDEGLFERYRTLRDSIGEGWSLDELEDQHLHAIRFLQTV